MYLNEMENKQKDYDDFLNEHTGFSIYQVLLCVGAFSLTFTTAAFQQIAIFLSAVPSYRLVKSLRSMQSCLMHI